MPRAPFAIPSYKHYDVELRFPSGLAGAMPLGDSATKQRYVALLLAGATNEIRCQLDAEGVVTEEAIEAYFQANTSVFRRTAAGEPFIPGNAFNSCLRDAAKLADIRGIKTGLLRRTIMEGGVLAPDEILVEGAISLEHRPVAPEVQGVRKPSLATLELAQDAVLRFPVQVLDNGVLSDGEFKALLNLASGVGMGGFRRLGHGRFTVAKCQRNGK